MMKKIIDDIRLGFKVIPYTLQAKTNIVIMIIFMAIGLFEDIVGQGRIFFGLYFLALTPLYSSQFIYAVCISRIAQVSPEKRRLNIMVPTALELFLSLVNYVIIVLLRMLYFHTGNISGTVPMGLLYYGVIQLFMSFYGIFVFRKPVLGYSLLVILVFFMEFTGGFYTHLAESSSGMPYLVEKLSVNPLFESFGACAILGFILVIISTLVFYLLSVLMYRQPLSEKMYRRAFEKAKRS